MKIIYKSNNDVDDPYLSNDELTGVVVSFNFVLLKLPYWLADVFVFPLYLYEDRSKRGFIKSIFFN